jgi:hypothetical protein
MVDDDHLGDGGLELTPLWIYGYYGLYLRRSIARFVLAFFNPRFIGRLHQLEASASMLSTLPSWPGLRLCRF